MSTATLERMIEKARTYKMSPQERREQRVSMMMGVRATKSSMTREQLIGALDKIEGRDGGTGESDAA